MHLPSVNVMANVGECTILTCFCDALVAGTQKGGGFGALLCWAEPICSFCDSLPVRIPEDEPGRGA